MTLRLLMSRKHLNNRGTMDTEVFRSSGKRLAVSYTWATVDDYKPIDGKKGKRKMLVCVLREAYTGTPFTGCAVFKPKDEWDWDIAWRLATKRAIKAFCAGTSFD